MAQFEINNILDKKLKKDYEVLVPYSLIDGKINIEVFGIQKKYKMKGFRQGQVPLDIIKHKYERSIMADESEKIINEISQKIVKDNDLKLAIAPKIDIKVFELKKDLSYIVSMELFPEVPEIELSQIKLVKREAGVEKKDIQEAIEKITNSHKEWDKQDNSVKSKKGDAVNIDYVGKIDDEVFEGGSAKSHQLELGSKSFIDDFEDQLIGKRSGDEVKVKVKFPKEYHNEKFAGKKAIFDVKVNSVLRPKNLEINDKFIKEKFGIESLVKFEEEIEKQIAKGYEVASKNLFKKDLLEFLNKKYNFELPEGLVDEQFKSIWSATQKDSEKKDLEKNPEKSKNEKEEKKLKAEKRELAEKMVRSGIILSNISQNNKLKVTNEELMAQINKKAAQFPGQEQMVAQYYQNNPEAVQEIRSDLFEEKVVDFIIENAKIEIKKISFKDLEKELNKS